MNSRDHEPLSHEERDLAQRLSRLGGHAAPSATLDATILAAARDAVRAPTRRGRARWPFGVGIAASLAIAVGVAWQLRPMPDAELLQVPSETATAARMLEPAPPPVATTPAPGEFAAPAARDADTAPSQAPAEAAGIAEAATERTQQAQRSEQVDTAPVARELRAAAPMPDIAPAPAPAVPAPPPAPPAPPAAPSPPLPTTGAAPAAPPRVAAPAPQEAAAAKALSEDRERQAQATSSAASMRAAGARADESALDRITVTGSRVRRAEPVAADRLDEYLDQPMDDEPPVSFASPQARDAWLQRVRELADEGDKDAARASLREFRRRYPQHPVPADLKALLEE